MAISVGSITIPIYTRMNGKEFEIGTIEIPIEYTRGTD